MIRFSNPSEISTPMKSSKKSVVQVDLFGDPIEDTRPSDPAVLSIGFEDHSVRMTVINGESWWVAADLCLVLGLEQSSRALSRLDDDEKGVTTAHTPGGIQTLATVNESGLYSLVLTSRKPEAKRFKKWLTSEVLPSIRKTGTYSIGNSDRVGVMAKRLRCDRGTAKTRCELVDANKANNKRLAAEGNPPNGFRDFHNATYRGQFGKEAPELRKVLGLKPRQTPLDRLGLVPLAAHNHTKILMDKIAKESPTPITNEEQCRLAETIAAEMTAADFGRLGEGWRFAVVDDHRRGPVLDVVKQLPSGQMMELASVE